MIYQFERLDNCNYFVIWKDFDNLYGWQKIDGKEAEDMKKIYFHYIDKRSEIMKHAQFRNEEVFGDVISKDSTSSEQITKQKNCLVKIMWILISV